MSEEPERELFCERLKRLRLAAGYRTQVALANRATLSNVVICRWESNYGLPDARSLLLLSRVLHCSIDYLLTGRESPYRAPPSQAPNVALLRAVSRQH